METAMSTGNPMPMAIGGPPPFGCGRKTGRPAAGACIVDEGACALSASEEENEEEKSEAEEAETEEEENEEDDDDEEEEERLG